MKRITKRDVHDFENHTDDLICDEFFGVSALNQLKLYENYHEDLQREFQQTKDKLEQLRLNDQMKTVTFKQLFSTKLQIEWTLLRLEKYLKK